MVVDTKFDRAMRRLEPGDVISNIPGVPGKMFMTLLHREGEQLFFSLVMREDNCALMPGSPFTWDGTVMRDVTGQPWDLFSTDWIVEKGNALLAARAYQDLLRYVLPAVPKEEAQTACAMVYPMEILQVRGLMFDGRFDFYETYRRILKLMEHVDESAQPILWLEVLRCLYCMREQEPYLAASVGDDSAYGHPAESLTTIAVRELQRRNGKLDS